MEDLSNTYITDKPFLKIFSIMTIPLLSNTLVHGLNDVRRQLKY